MLGVSFHRLSLAVSRFGVYRFSSMKSKKDTLDLKEDVRRGLCIRHSEEGELNLVSKYTIYPRGRDRNRMDLILLLRSSLLNTILLIRY